MAKTDKRKRRPSPSKSPSASASPSRSPSSSASASPSISAVSTVQDLVLRSVQAQPDVPVPPNRVGAILVYDMRFMVP